MEKERKTSYIIYFCLVFILCFSTFLFEILNKRGAVMAHCFTDYSLAMLLNMRISVNMLALANALYRLIAYGLIGFFGLCLLFKTGFKNIINDELKNYKNIIIIAAVGIIMGLFFVGNQIFIKDISGILLLQYSYSNLPSSIFASVAEGIGCQILNMTRIVFLCGFLQKYLNLKKVI